VAGRLAKIAPTLDGLPARLRSQPSALAPVIGQVPAGTTIRVVGGPGSAAPGGAGWVRVTWRGLTGYLPAPLVS
jgi:hypothetical protein